MKPGNRFLMGSLVVAVLVLGLVAPLGQTSLAAGAIIYVDADASGAGDGTSWADAFTNLQAALDIAASGDQIWVAEGIYKPTVEHGGTGDRYRSFQMKNGVAIYGGFDPSLDDTAWDDRDWESHLTILSGDLNGDDEPNFTNYTENSYHVFYHPAALSLESSAVLDGFTIIGGNANGLADHAQGGGMYNYYSSPALINVVFTLSNANFGGGMFNDNSSEPVLTEVAFHANLAGQGGGMANYFLSNPRLVKVTFTGNSASSGGGMYNYYQSSPSLTNVVFSANRSGWEGGGMHNVDYSNPTLTNVTFAANDGGIGTGMYNYNSDPIISNAIFWGGSTSPISNDVNSAPLITYSVLQGGCPSRAVCTKVINLDPQFVRNPSPGSDGTWGTADDDYGDLRLQLTSPAIDAGNNTVVPTGITTDLDDNPRFVDIPFVLNTGLGTPPIVDMGAYETQLPVLADTVLYVTPDGLGNCLSWADACDLRSALLMAGPETEIWLQKGVHKPTTGSDRTATFTLKSNVAVYGGFAGIETQREQRNWETNVTILSGDIGLAGEHSDDSFHVVFCSGLETTTILDGFTIRDSYANGPAPNNSGGGLYNSHCNTTLTNLIFTYNAAYTGGGMYNNASSPMLTKVTFVNNWASNGGGMTNDNSSPTLSDVALSANQASSSGGGIYNTSSSPTLDGVIFSGNSAVFGGGLYNGGGSSPVLTNVSFIANTVSDSGGGMYNDWSVAWLRNVKFTGNQAMQGGGMYNEVSNPTLYNVTFAGNISGYPGGGMCNDHSYPTVYNGIFWGNIPDQINNSESMPIIYYSDIQEGCPFSAECSQVINLDPQFMRNPAPGADGTWGTPDDDYGDLRLQLTSPAIDAGVNSVVPPDITTDLLGLPRFVDILSVLDTGFGTPPLVDMGAYEAQSVVVYLPLVTK